MRTIRVEGPGFEPYEVLVGHGLLGRAGEQLAPFARTRRVLAVSDEIVDPLYGAALEQTLAAKGLACVRLVVPAGEHTKSFEGLERLCDQLLQAGAERQDLIVALGGGVVGDLAGFAAAIVKRGLDFAQIPTTLLAQVDSSVGGKTAIDTPRGKNLIGAFWQPRRVLCDLDLLASLPERQMRAGYAEVLKYGLLGDRAFFERLETDGAAVIARSPGPLEAAVARSVEMKAEIVGADAREAGRRALLNLGHTFAHALEAETGFSDALAHGEAVALGCAMAFRFSARLRLCAESEARRATGAVAAAGLPTRLSDLGRPMGADRLIEHMRQDKKAEAGQLVLILARAIGDAFVAKGVESDRLRDHLIDEGALP